MDKEKAIQILKRCEAESHCEHYKRHYCCIGCGQREALDLAIEALEREIEYGQMVVDYTKGEALKSGDWGYTNTPIDTPTDTSTNDCVSRQQAIEAIEGVDWYHVNSQGELVSGSTSDEESWYKAEDIYEALESLKPVTPPRKVVAEIKVDTEELAERIKEEYQLEQEHGRLIDADKLLQELFIVDEEEWTTPEIRAILENAPAIITSTERTGEWIDMSDGGRIKYIWYEKYMCNKCGERGTSAWSFCPNCGAKMGE